ncbi:hypothetical protein ES703_107499 [subsurface metagenome]
MASLVSAVMGELSLVIKAVTSAAVSERRLMRCFCILSIISAVLFTLFSLPVIIKLAWRAVIWTPRD